MNNFNRYTKGHETFSFLLYLRWGMGFFLKKKRKKRVVMFKIQLARVGSPYLSSMACFGFVTTIPKRTGAGSKSFSAAPKAAYQSKIGVKILHPKIRNAISPQIVTPGILVHLKLEEKKGTPTKHKCDFGRRIILFHYSSSPGVDIKAWKELSLKDKSPPTATKKPHTREAGHYSKLQSAVYVRQTDKGLCEWRTVRHRKSPIPGRNGAM